MPKIARSMAARPTRDWIARFEPLGTLRSPINDYRQVFEKLGSSLERFPRTLDPDQVVANYTTDGVLLPMVSNRPRKTHAEIRDYFVEFLKKGPQGKIDRHIIRIGCNVAQDVGTYTFRFKDGGIVHARHTYVYEWVDGQWLIAHHHSSAMPKIVSAK